MIRDLANPGHDAAEIFDDADVCVVGAGIAGITIAARLRNRGLRVVILESGGRDHDEPAQALNEVEITGHPYKGASQGRTRGLGGNSTIWGGALLPFTPTDFMSDEKDQSATWPINFADLEPYIDDVEKMFGLPSGPYEASNELNTTFLRREAKWPSFANRNLALVHKEKLRDDPGLVTWLNATVTNLVLSNERDKIVAVKAKALNGTSLHVSAKHTIIAAGAIESTRLLLLFDKANDNRLDHLSATLGRYFHDHLSLPLGRIETDRPSALNHFAGFRFEKGSMRSLRFEFNNRKQRHHSLRSGFVHIAFRPLEESGFDHVRSFLQSIQKGRPNLAAGLRCAGDLPYLAKAIYWRFGHRQLLWPQPSEYNIHVVAEQAPHQDNRILLNTQLDAFGQRMASIDWHVREEDAKTFQTLALAFDRFWSTYHASLGGIIWNVAPKNIGPEHLRDVDDIYHPGGSTRMANHASHGVVDKNCGVFGLSGISIVSTSVFPTGGTANPTMTLVMIAMRVADHLCEELKGHTAQTKPIVCFKHSSFRNDN